MKATSMMIRPFNIGGAFEIRMPNGKVILVDPCFRTFRADKTYTSVFLDGLTREDITGADYILLTHSHYDHDLDVGYFTEKFQSKVFCSAMVAEELLKYHNLCYDNIVPIFPNSRYTLEDFTLETFQAKHNYAPNQRFEEDYQIAAKVGVTDHCRLDQLGCLMSLDFLITTHTNFSVLVSSGQIVWTDIFDICRERRPNVLLRQATIRENGQQLPPEKLARILVRYGAQVIIPFHHEGMIRSKGEIWTADYMEQVAQWVTNLEPGMVFLAPKAWQWYSLGIDISPV